MTVSLNIPYVSDKIPLSIQIGVAGIVFGLFYFIYSTLAAERPFKGIPVVSLSEKGLGPKESWTHHGTDTLSKGLQTYSGPFQVITGTGPKIILPNRYAEEVKSHPNLSFSGATAKDFFPQYPGFDAFRPTTRHEGFHAEVVRVKLTQSLGLITDDLVEETTDSIYDIFGEDSQWHQIPLKQNIMHLVARLSSRVLLGKTLCRNERWLEIAKNYTVNAFLASRLLRAAPSLLRPIVYWFLPQCTQLRKDVRDARVLISPEVELRKARVQKALDAGQKAPKTADAIGWMYELARENREHTDYAMGQLTLSMAAVHTTTEATTQALLDMILHPEVIQPLRDEVINVVGKEGWSKTSLYKLRLMDSFLKESQRHHPPNLVTMHRLVSENITLSDGTVLPAGARTVVANRYKDTEIYDNPGDFDAYRFLREREKPGQMNAHQHVTVSDSHMAFGYGQHACPGRFFASNEIKIAFAHLLLKYDWKVPEGEEKNLFVMFETSISSNPKCQVELRRRQEEVDLDRAEPLE